MNLCLLSKSFSFNFLIKFSRIFPVETKRLYSLHMCAHQDIWNYSDNSFDHPIMHFIFTECILMGVGSSVQRSEEGFRGLIFFHCPGFEAQFLLFLAADPVWKVLLYICVYVAFTG